MKSNPKKILWTTLGLFFACYCIVALINDPPRKKETAEIKVSATPTSYATEAPLPTETPAPTLEPAFIPGIAPADITVNLEDRKFDCASAESQTDPFTESEYYAWYCKRADEAAQITYYVDFNARTLGTVDYINVSILQLISPSNEIASAFLQYMATIPFIGSDEYQAQAKKWVETEIPLLKGEGDIHSTTINGVRMELFGIPSAITLRMGDIR